MPKVNSTYVPPTGLSNAKVMVVGEAPGENEEKQLKPFVGDAGQFVERYIGRAGYEWEKTFRTNLCKYRPEDNKFHNLLGSGELEKGLEELNEEIEKVNPNLIIAFGNWPMWYLTGKANSKGTPGTGITSWRGSVVEGSERYLPAASGKKVLITFHPAYIIRPAGFGNHPIFFNDLKRVKEEAKSPKLTYPTFETYIDPPNLREIADEMSKSEWLTVDIETFGNSLACVGFADSVDRALCITYEYPGDGWEVVQQLLSCKAKKNFQYGVLDINYLWHYYGWEVENYAFDTFIASANLLPELPRSLAFLNSIYTPFPYYKEDRKKYRETGDLSSLWTYNVQDCISQHWVMLEQFKELEELYGLS